MKSSWFSLIVVFLILTAGWWITPTQIESVPLCFFNYFFHFDCPGCGLTRSFLALARGHFFQAFHYNAAAPLVYFLFVGYVVQHIRKILGKRPLIIPVPVGKIYSLGVVTLLFGQWGLKFFY